MKQHFKSCEEKISEDLSGLRKGWDQIQDRWRDQKAEEIEDQYLAPIMMKKNRIIKELQKMQQLEKKFYEIAGR